MQRWGEPGVFASRCLRTRAAQCASTSGKVYRLRRSTRVLLAIAVGLLVPLGIGAAPAFAGKNANAPITESCRSGQTTIAVQFVLTEVPKWQKITVRTADGAIARDHASFNGETNASGTATYDISVSSEPTGAATAWISNDAWSGTFRMTGVTCRSPEAARVSGQGSSCDSEPQITVQVTNPNPGTVAYRIGGELPDQNTDIGGGQSKELVFGDVERGGSYRIAAAGSDGTVGATRVNVPACATPTQPTTNPTAVPPGAPTPSHGATTAPGAPGVPASASAGASTATSISPSPNTSLSPKASPSPDSTPVPTVEVNVDEFAGLRAAQEGETTILAAPQSGEGLFSNGLTLGIVTFVLVGLIATTLLLARRRAANTMRD